MPAGTRLAAARRGDTGVAPAPRRATACSTTATPGSRSRRSSRRWPAALLDRFGAVVTRDTLADRAWPRGVPTRNALDVHVLRLRRRIAPLGLEIRTVRSRGYLMQVVRRRCPC